MDLVGVRLVGVRVKGKNIFLDDDDELDLQDSGFGWYVYLKDVAQIKMKNGVTWDLTK